MNALVAIFLVGLAGAQAMSHGMNHPLGAKCKTTSECGANMFCSTTCPTTTTTTTGPTTTTTTGPTTTTTTGPTTTVTTTTVTTTTVTTTTTTTTTVTTTTIDGCCAANPTTTTAGPKGNTGNAYV